MNGRLKARDIMQNPYDLIKIKINGKESYGRPVDFDSVPIDTHTLLNKDGVMIRPSVLTSICPDCGQGLVISVTVEEYPNNIIKECELCAASHKRPVKRINKLVDQKTLSKDKISSVMDIQSTVKERLCQANVELKSVEESDKIVSESIENINEPKKIKPKRPKKKRKVDLMSDGKQKCEPDFADNNQTNKLEKAVGMTEEQEIDDTDLIEEE